MEPIITTNEGADADMPVDVSNLRDRWQGEDEDEDVKENWDDDDEEPKSEPLDEVPKPKPPKKNKLKDKIAEKEAAAAAKLNRPMTQEEILADKLERQRLQEEADLNAGREAFGISAGGGTGLDGPLVSKEDFDEFKKRLVTRLQSVEKSGHYIGFLESTFRELCASLDPDDIKRLSSNLTTLYNEKLKSLKGPAKKKNKPKAGIKVERSAIDVGDEYDDFEDFM